MERTDSLTQLVPVKKAGHYRIRLAFAQKTMPLWQKDHLIFVGCVYKGTCFCGYQCGVSPYLGVYELRCVSSVSSQAEAPAYLTGGGNKMEFDLDLEVRFF